MLPLSSSNSQLEKLHFYFFWAKFLITSWYGLDILPDFICLGESPVSFDFFSYISKGGRKLISHNGLNHKISVSHHTIIKHRSKRSLMSQNHISLAISAIASFLEGPSNQSPLSKRPPQSTQEHMHTRTKHPPPQPKSKSTRQKRQNTGCRLVSLWLSSCFTVFLLKFGAGRFIEFFLMDIISFLWF